MIQNNKTTKTDKIFLVLTFLYILYTVMFKYKIPTPYDEMLLVLMLVNCLLLGMEKIEKDGIVHEKITNIKTAKTLIFLRIFFLIIFFLTFSSVLALHLCSS